MIKFYWSSPFLPLPLNLLKCEFLFHNKMSACPACLERGTLWKNVTGGPHSAAVSHASQSVHGGRAVP